MNKWKESTQEKGIQSAIVQCLIPMIFSFLPCVEKAQDKKEFSCEILKISHESQILTC